MTDQKEHDEVVLIDFLLRRCEPATARQLEDRLKRDEAFKRLHDDLANAMSALRTLPDPEPSHDLAEKTLTRIHTVRRTEALLAKEEMARPALQPTFSLRELTAAAAAIVVLAVIFIPSVYEARTLAQIRECGAQVGRIGAALWTYANGNEGYLPAVEEGRRWLPGPGAAASNSAALFKLIRRRYVQTPVLFQCPAVGGSSFQVKAGMTDFPAAEYISYSYQHAVGAHRLRRDEPALAAVAENMAILADSSPIFRGGRFHPNRLNAKASDNHAGTGQNVLYLDMHVQWHQAPTVGVGGDNISLLQGVFEYRGDEVPTVPTDSFLLPSYSPLDLRQ